MEDTFLANTETVEYDAHNPIPVPPLPPAITDPECFRDEDNLEWNW